MFFNSFRVAWLPLAVHGTPLKFRVPGATGRQGQVLHRVLGLTHDVGMDTGYLLESL